MAGETFRNKVNIGLSSLILIFIVLCLSTFGLLSLSSARGDLKLAERGAEAVKAYYEADSKGQQWLEKTDALLMRMEGKSLAEKYAALAAEPGNVYDEAAGCIFTDIPMEKGQSLRIEAVLIEGSGGYEIRAWYVYDSGEYDIDDAMPVWDGKGEPESTKAQQEESK